jgi:hypothetical protein
VTAREYDALREHGEVRALIANNTYHHMGQAQWRALAPNAISYAPRDACETLSKKAPGITFRPLSELSLPDHVRYIDPPGYKTGEAMFSVRASRGAVWFTGDLLTNIQRIPKPPIRWLFTWTNSAPGFRLFAPAVWMLIRDKKALRTAMLDHLANDPPKVVIPAHGPAFEAEEIVALARTQIERL